MADVGGVVDQDQLVDLSIAFCSSSPLGTTAFFSEYLVLVQETITFVTVNMTVIFDDFKQLLS